MSAESDKVGNRVYDVAFVGGPIENSENQPSKDVVRNTIVESARKGGSCNGFNPDAFKSAFFGPLLILKRRKTRLQRKSNRPFFLVMLGGIIQEKNWRRK